MDKSNGHNSFRLIFDSDYNLSKIAQENKSQEMEL